jgi:hypothetical protein
MYNMANQTIVSNIPNTTMDTYITTTGKHIAYLITPVDGYVMHDTGYDIPHYDDEGNLISVELGYRRTTASVPSTYDFTVGSDMDINGKDVITFGDRKFYTLSEDEVYPQYIFGGGQVETTGGDK